MNTACEDELEHIGESRGCADHDHDLVHELSKRLDTLWRCDQCIANAEGHSKLLQFWHDVKRQEQDNIVRLKELIADEIRAKCF